MISPPVGLRASSLYIGTTVISFGILASTATSQETITIKGIVVDDASHPIPFAYVAIDKGASTVSGVDGLFSIRASRPASDITFSARRLGFSPARQNIPADSLRYVRLTLSALPAGLPNVQIRTNPGGYDEYLDRSGFYRRVAKAVDGIFINRDQVERRNPSELTAMLTDVRSIRVEREYGKRGKRTYVLGRGGICTLGLVIDGQRIETASPGNESVQPRMRTSIAGGMPSTQARSSAVITESIDDLVPVNMIGAIEVYPSAASVPNEFNHHTDGCGLIVVWTRFRP